MSSTDDPSGGRAGDDQPSMEHAKNELKREGQRLAGETKEEALRFADEKKSAAAGFLRDIGEAVSTATREMRSKGHGHAASVADVAAEEIEYLAGQLDQRDLNELVREVEAFARRRPALFFGASALAGFAAMRFLKSTSEPGNGEEPLGGAAGGET